MEEVAKGAEGQASVDLGEVALEAKGSSGVAGGWGGEL